MRQKQAIYRGNRIILYKPFYTPGASKKRAVYVEKDGKIYIVRFGDQNMKIKAYSQKHRDSFNARHKCDTANDISTARYWSCIFWNK